MVSRLTIIPMARRQKTLLSTSDSLGAFALIITLLAVVLDVNWAVRSALVLIAIGTIVFAGQRHNSHPFPRLVIAVLLICIFSYSPWSKIWADFHAAHPDIEWPRFVVRPWFHCTLAVGATVALLSGVQVWTYWRRYVFLFRSRLLRERIWIDKAAALAIIKTSEWASVRNPSSLSALLMSSFPGFSPERGILFDRFVELTLRNFSEKGDWAAREVDGAMQYEEHALREFLDNALSADAIKKFGDVPH